MDDRKMSKEVICISSVDWYPIPTRKQQLMSRLPEEYKVLYVEPPITLLSPIKDRGVLFKLIEFLKGLKKIKSNVYTYSPPPILPFGNIYRFINKINQWWISTFIKRQSRKMGFNFPLVWTYMPNSLELINKLNYEALIYDCVDEHSEYQGFINKDTMLQMEQELIEACDIVLVTAQGLYDSKSKYNKNTYLVPNGANFDLFNKVTLESTPIAEDIKSIKGPIVGFIGVIQEWIDLDLIYNMAKDNPSWSIVMIGPVGAGIDVSALKALSNVHFLGKKKPEELPSYIKAFGVCINPFRQSELTRNVSPLKFYEYLATGKPIVTVDMPAVRQFADCVAIAKDNQEFVELVRASLRKQDIEGQAKRVAKGKESSWDSKVVEVLNIITKELANNRKSRL